MRIQPKSTDPVDEVEKPESPDVLLAHCLLEILSMLIDDSWTDSQKVGFYDSVKPRLERIVRGRRG